MVAGSDRHLYANVIPPIEARANRQHDPVLRRRLVGARWHEQSGASHPVRIELLDDNAVEEWSKLITHAHP